MRIELHTIDDALREAEGWLCDVVETIEALGNGEWLDYCQELRTLAALVDGLEMPPSLKNLVEEEAAFQDDLMAQYDSEH